MGHIRDNESGTGGSGAVYRTCGSERQIPKERNINTLREKEEKTESEQRNSVEKLSLAGQNCQTDTLVNHPKGEEEIFKRFNQDVSTETRVMLKDIADILEPYHDQATLWVSQNRLKIEHLIPIGACAGEDFASFKGALRLMLSEKGIGKLRFFFEDFQKWREKYLTKSKRSYNGYREQAEKSEPIKPSTKLLAQLEKEKDDYFAGYDPNAKIERPWENRVKEEIQEEVAV